MADRALAYVRISQMDQSLYSVETQLAAIRQYADAHGYVIVGTYNDGHSGALYRERPALTDLREAVRRGEADVVIAYDTDRFSRDTAHIFVLFDEFEHYHARLEFVLYAFEATAIGKFILAAKTFAAEVEREKIIERSTRGRLARAKAGKLIPGARPLYGYQWSDERSRYVPDVLTAPVVERIYRAAAEGQPLLSIAEALTRDGIPTPTGKRVWAQSSVQHILRHPSYGGASLTWLWRPPEGRKNAHIDRDGAVTLPEGVIPPLVPVALWQAVQRVLSENRHRARTRASHQDAALLRAGHARCGHCGYPLYVSPRRDKLVYRCESRYRFATDCTVHGIDVDELDAAAWVWLADVIGKPETLAAYRETQPDDPRDDERDRLRRRITEIERQQSNAARRVAAIDDDAVAAPILAQLRALADQRAALATELATLERVDAHDALILDRVQDLEAVALRLRGRLDTLSFAERRMLVELAGLEAAFFRAGVTPRYTFRLRDLG